MKKKKLLKNLILIVINMNVINYIMKNLVKLQNQVLKNVQLKKDVQRNDIIPIICDRSPSHIIGILGISKAGCAFLPIDKKLPMDRIKFILDEVDPKIILFNNTHDIAKKLINENYNVYDLEKYNYKLNNDSINNINESDDTCYVLFTSGTTGKPKGALISHFNIYNNVRRFNNEEYDMTENICVANYLQKDGVENVLAITNFTFDISHNEITLSLINGLTIVLVDDNLSEEM
eukprot:jgi/Orpsp1_1/1188690/evm.model.d7180000066523.1